MTRTAITSLLVAGVLALTACASDAAPQERPTVRAADDPAGDVELTIDLTTAPDEPKFAQVDLTRVELQRRGSGVRVLFSLAGPVGVDGYRTELTYSAATRTRAKTYRSVLVIAYLSPDGASAGVRTTEGLGANGSSQQCGGEVTVAGDQVRVDVARGCVLPAFRGRAGAGTSLYTDSEDSENAIAHDGLLFKGRKGFPAAP